MCKKIKSNFKHKKTKIVLNRADEALVSSVESHVNLDPVQRVEDLTNRTRFWNQIQAFVHSERKKKQVRNALESGFPPPFVNCVTTLTINQE